MRSGGADSVKMLSHAQETRESSKSMKKKYFPVGSNQSIHSVLIVVNIRHSNVSSNRKLNKFLYSNQIDHDIDRDINKHDDDEDHDDYKGQEWFQLDSLLFSYHFFMIRDMVRHDLLTTHNDIHSWHFELHYSILF